MPQIAGPTSGIELYNSSVSGWLWRECQLIDPLKAFRLGCIQLQCRLVNAVEVSSSAGRHIIAPTYLAFDMNSNST